jgi:RNase P subunit RPR2
MRRLFRKRCPACRAKSLVARQFLRVTIEIEGRRAPDACTYYECIECGAKYKLSQRHGISLVEPGEWRRIVEEASSEL